MSIDLSNLKSALKTLKSSMVTLDANKSCDFSDMLEDSCIKRFEYTLEISRKLMKKNSKKNLREIRRRINCKQYFQIYAGV